MFNWLKKLFKDKSVITDEVASFPFPAAKGQDESVLAPYKVEAPKVEEKPARPVKPAVSKKPATKKVPVKKPSAGTRGRKPKAKPTVK